ADAQAGAHDASCPADFARHRPVEEGEIDPGRSHLVRVEEVVGAHVVLVDAPLHQAHAHRSRIEPMVPADVGRDGRQMMDAQQIHRFLPISWMWSALDSGATKKNVIPLPLSKPARYVNPGYRTVRSPTVPG